MPESEGASRSTTVLLILCGVALTVVVAVSTGFLGILLGWLTGDTTAQKGDDSAKKVDLAEAPFTVKRTASKEDPSFFKFVLPRALTAEERGRFRAPDYVPDLGALGGGQKLGYGVALTQAQHAPDLPNPADSSSFNLQLHSERKSKVTITDMRARVLRCRASTAQTVIEYPSQGEETYRGVLFDLTAKGRAPAIATDEDEQQGNPYFQKKVINLGEGETVANLQVVSLTKGRTCEWVIDYEYVDAGSDQAKWITLPKESAPYVSEGMPEKPADHWLWSVATPELPAGGWVDCTHAGELEYLCRPPEGAP